MPVEAVNASDAIRLEQIRQEQRDKEVQAERRRRMEEETRDEQRTSQTANATEHVDLSA